MREPDEFLDELEIEVEDTDWLEPVAVIEEK